MTAHTDEDMNAGIGVEQSRHRGIRRVGCGAALVIWFLLLLTPCLLLVLAVQGELRIATGAAPGQELRVWLIMEADARGAGISNGTVHVVSDDDLCVETQVSYVLWTGQEDGQTYCDCYERTDDDEGWSSISSVGGACQE